MSSSAMSSLNVRNGWLDIEYTHWICAEWDDICGRRDAPGFEKAARGLSSAAGEVFRTTEIPCVRSVARAALRRADVAISISPLLARGESMQSSVPEGVAANEKLDAAARACNRILRAAGIPDYGPYFELDGVRIT